MSKTIWVYAEVNGGEIAPVTFELLAKAREISASSDYTIYAILLGSKLDELPNLLIRYGAEKVICVDDSVLADYKTLAYAQALKSLAEKYHPDVFILGATSQGRDLAPRVQAKLGTGLTADCLDIKFNEEGLLLQSKPFYGDNFMCDIICPQRRPQMATIRPKIFLPLAPIANASGEVIRETMHIEDDTDFDVITQIPLEKNTGAVDEAERVLGLGAGVDSDEIIEKARELANLLGAAIGVTRPLTDNGKFQHHEQIGQSGVTVAPKVILNLGISGAVQYTVSIMNAERIISVDKNKNAPIYRISDYGYTGDINELIPALLERLS